MLVPKPVTDTGFSYQKYDYKKRAVVSIKKKLFKMLNILNKTELLIKVAFKLNMDNISYRLGKSKNLKSLYLFIYLFILFYLFIFLSFCYFFGPLPQHMEVPRLGVESEL